MHNAIEEANLSPLLLVLHKMHYWQCFSNCFDID